MMQQPNDELMTAAQVRAHFGGISDMSLWRWERQLGFPKPDAVINRRKFWRRSAIMAWQTAQAETPRAVDQNPQARARGLEEVRRARKVAA